MALFTTSDNIQLYYEKKGDGHPIIFMHGWQSTCNCFDVPFEILSENYCCVRYDHRGHHRSAVSSEPPTIKRLAQDLYELIRYLQFDNVTLVGWSMGGITAFQYASDYGCDRLKSIIIIDSSPKLSVGDGWRFCKYCSNPDDYDAEHKADLEVMKQSFERFLQSYFCRMNPDFARLSENEQVASIQQEMRIHNAFSLASLWEDLHRVDHRKTVEEITVPLALFFGDHGSSYGKAPAEFCHAHSRSPVKMVEFVDATHRLLYEHSSLLAREIDTFLKETAFPDITADYNTCFIAKE